MSFRKRLTSFFVLIVLLPIVVVGLLVLSLINDSGRGKAQARAGGLASAASSLYAYDQSIARAAAASIARAAVKLPDTALSSRLLTVGDEAGLDRIVLTRGGHDVFVYGDSRAIAPGNAQYRRNGVTTTVSVSTISAPQFAASVSAQSSGSGVVIRENGHTLASTLGTARLPTLPKPGDPSSVSTDGHAYEAFTTRRVAGFGTDHVLITVLSDLRETNGSLSSSRILALAFLLGSLLLAISFAVLASRGLERQLGRFLSAARRLGGGDFSAPVPVEGSDQFAMLATEFNNMSRQLAQRLEQLSAERARLRDSIRRAGDTFASNLDRQALLELALTTAIDAAEADFGRLTARGAADGPLWELARANSLEDVADLVVEAERQALEAQSLQEVASDDTFVFSIPLGPVSPSGRPLGLITVGRRDRPFEDDDRNLVRSLVAQATLALANVELHQTAQRQAVTDELSGLANHGRFQDILDGEMEQVRRHDYPVGLIMLDLDDFKQINDNYGHPQGDLVLKHVARALKQSSRDGDSPARYGGEEMAIVLPHTDLAGSHAIAERTVEEIAALRIPRLDGDGFLQVTASLGVSATSAGDKRALIAAADAALYRAKRDGKNRVVKASGSATRLIS